MKKLLFSLLAASTLFVACGGASNAVATSTSITTDGRINVTDVKLVLVSDSNNLVQTDLQSGSTIKVKDMETDKICASFPYTNGKAEIDLAGIESQLKLTDSKEFFGQIIPIATVSNPEAKVSGVSFIAHSVDDRPIGDVLLTDLTLEALKNIDSSPSFMMVALLYSSEETNVTGETTTMGITIKADLKLKKGWNSFVSSTTINVEDETGVMNFTTPEVPSKNLQWIIRAM